MDKAFVSILQKLVSEQSRDALLNPARAKSFLADYTQGEYKKESRLLVQALDAGVQKAIDAAEDIALCKKQQVRVLREDYFLVDEVATDVVDTLALVLWGEEKEEKRCKNCGKELLEEWQFCPYCGTSFTQPVLPQTAPQDVSEELEYRVIANGTEIELAGYRGTKKIEVQIPPQIRNLPVTVIKYEAFHKKELISVIIPNSVTTIGMRAFSHNRLSYVSIPDSVTHIGNMAFAGNQLVSVTIPDSVTYIGNWAFAGNQLSSATIPDSVTYIGNWAFMKNQLTSISVPGRAKVDPAAFDPGVTVTRRKN